jgi:hypothetical protein
MNDPYYGDQRAEHDDHEAGLTDNPHGFSFDHEAEAHIAEREAEESARTDLVQAHADVATSVEALAFMRDAYSDRPALVAVLLDAERLITRLGWRLPALPPPPNEIGF